MLAETIQKRYCEWRFTVLLVAIVVLNIARTASVSMEVDRNVLDTLGAVFMFTATLSLCVEKRFRAAALILGIPAILLSLIGNLLSRQQESVVLTAGRFASMVFLVFTIAIILRTLLTQPLVTRDSISGAFCGYVLIGVTFAEIYCLIETAKPNSFEIAMINPDWHNDPFRRWLTLEYFSFTTLTTVGFGDIVPKSPLARGFAIWEAICGQFYLAVLVAGLVNLRASRPATPPDSSCR